ncbi:DUF1553 domain-containing protein [Tautonia plasticadhaerens]|uniref:Planctomycete cytochrome C n=1 Tax=Tautonia plasticadhaerens TaxID=2527974 RepID=A0A518HC62_9BACT|nr:DUF1553 domain-containing protein [Tautonia plasticadhaerens]QDV38445.1 Planctomycete cytochrome C [Tautonia plasticadhaerens]
MMRVFTIFVCSIAFAASVASPSPDLQVRGDGGRFDEEIAPLLSRRCLGCHNASDLKGELDLSRRATVLDGLIVVPGDPAASLLWEHVEADLMPPDEALPAVEKQALRTWIEQGAPWGTDPIDPFHHTSDTRAGYDWWSFRPISRPEPPALDGHGAAPSPIDRFVRARLAAEGLAPSPPADRRTLIRRLSFDLLGLPPTPDQVASFVADPAPDAYERLVDRLLASPHHGERMARGWLDVVRFGESNGFEHDELRSNAWRYRDWLVRAFNDDLPYTAFARLQLAGDVLRPGDPDAVVATGFLVAGAYDSVGQAQQSEAMRAVVRQDELEDIVGTTGQAFLGLTAHCARCHDHKFDPVRQLDYYRLASALGGVRHGERDVTLPREIEAYEDRLASARARLDRLRAERAALIDPVRRRLLDERGDDASRTPTPPEPVARWDFTRPRGESPDSPPVSLRGGASLDLDGLHVGGRGGFAVSEPLGVSLTSKTLEVWVLLDDLDQCGGGAISVQGPDGRVFDAIVFGEQEPRRWMAGSDSFRRTRPFGGPEEAEASDRPVHLALSYHDDGTIAAFRDGQPYGASYRSDGPVRFEAGEARVLFGLRHEPPGGNRFLSGVILRANLYDRALAADEVAASFRSAGEPIAHEEILALLGPGDRAALDRIEAELAEARRILDEPRPERLAYAVAPKDPEPSHLLIRGNPGQPGEVVSPGGVPAVPGPDADFGLPPDAADGSRRRALAEWIAHPENPLFARTIVNRLWQDHFGVGIVETPNDLGFNGGRPSHPELLDWLASELIRQGWSLKALRRAIVCSETYRQSSRNRPEAAALDADNRLLWRMSPRRLEAESLRDAMLAVSGTLRRSMGGPGDPDFRHRIRGGTHFYDMDPALDAEAPRRSLYRVWARGGRNPLLDTFDCPDPSTTAPTRRVTTTPLQALALLNNDFVLECVDRLADRLEREAPGDPEGQVERAYRLAFGRPPNVAEADRATRSVREFGPAVLCRAILNSNEFLYVD